MVQLDLKLGRFEDVDATNKPVDKIEEARLEELGIIDEITNPIAGKYALKDYGADALKEVSNLGRSKDSSATLYQNLVLYPKATSQMAKTILHHLLTQETLLVLLLLQQQMALCLLVNS